jgi:hypothetical protein
MAKIIATWSNMYGEATIKHTDLSNMSETARLDFLGEVKTSIDAMYKQAQDDWSKWCNALKPHEVDNGSN